MDDVRSIELQPPKRDVRRAMLLEHREYLQQLKENHDPELADDMPTNESPSPPADQQPESDVRRLEKELRRAIRQENYELAARLRDEITRRTKNQQRNGEDG